MHALALVLFAAAVATSVSAWGGAHVDTRRVSDFSLLSAIAKRQSGCETTACTSADATTLNGVSACPTSDTAYLVCTCTVLESLSSACLDCVLSLSDETAAELQADCAQAYSEASAPTVSVTGAATVTATGAAPTTTTACSDECTSTSDASALNTALNCDRSDASCVCPAAESMSTDCAACFLGFESYTPAGFESFCAGGSTGTSASGGSSASATMPTAAGSTGAAAPTSNTVASPSAASPSASATKSGAMSIQGANVGMVGVLFAGLFGAVVCLL